MTSHCGKNRKEGDPISPHDHCKHWHQGHLQSLSTLTTASRAPQSPCHCTLPGEEATVVPTKSWNSNIFFSLFGITLMLLLPQKHPHLGPQPQYKYLWLLLPSMREKESRQTPEAFAWTLMALAAEDPKSFQWCCLESMPPYPWRQGHHCDFPEVKATVLHLADALIPPIGEIFPHQSKFIKAEDVSLLSHSQTSI